tara:strand:- start:14 stop:247 length:234 start_codon:yes stop_codon:yes gene_type:complete
MLILNVLVIVAVLLAVMDSERYVAVCTNLANQPTTLAIRQQLASCVLLRPKAHNVTIYQLRAIRRLLPEHPVRRPVG